jgi:hypothetical protein
VIRRAFALLTVAFVLAGFVLADDPPPRLKKKARPVEDAPAKKEEPDAKDKDKEQKKPAEPPRLPDKPKVDDDPDMPPPEEEIDEQEVLNRVAKNMRASEDRLGNKELGEDTQQVQRDIVKDLEDLIRQTQNGGQGGQDNQQDQQNQGGQQNQQQQKQRQQQSKGSAGQPKSNQRGQSNQRAQREARRSQKRGQQQRAQGQQQQGPQQNQGDQQQGANNPRAGGSGPQGEQNKIAEVYKDIWGHLPETLRAEMDAYGREKFMTKYEELIKRYYDRAARESRRKGD